MPFKDPEKRREYSTEYHRKWYEKHPEARREKIAKRKAKIKNWWLEYIKQLSCLTCGEKHPGCLQFHHRNPEEKDYNVSTMVNSGLSIKRILEEVEKCDVLCSNCHDKLHWEERNGDWGCNEN